MTSSELTARDNGDGTATITFTVENLTISSTGDLQSLLDQLSSAEAALRWSPSRIAEERRRLWHLVAGAASRQLGMHGHASPTRIRIESEEWDNGHFASDTVDVWLDQASVRNRRPDAQIQLVDLSCEIDFTVFDGCGEGRSWTLDISHDQVATALPVTKAS